MDPIRESADELSPATATRPGRRAMTTTATRSCRSKGKAVRSLFGPVTGLRVLHAMPEPFPFPTPVASAVEQDQHARGDGEQGHDLRAVLETDGDKDQ